MSSFFPPFSSTVAQQPSVARQTLESGEAGARAAQAPQSPLAQREAMLAAVAFVARCFLLDGWEMEVEEALERVGEALEVSRATVFERIECATPLFTPRYEWNSPHSLSGTETPRALFDLCESPLSAWLVPLASGEAVYANTQELDEPIRSALDELGIASLANVPIFVDGEWWGYLSIDDIHSEHDWGEAQLETLQMCADLFGAGIARGRANVASRESEAELRALLSLMSDVLIVLDRRGVYHKIVTSNPSILAAPIGEMLGRSLNEVLDVATASKFLGVIDCALDTRTPVRFEYSLQIDERELWFDATVTPLNEEQVVWVARDVTGARRDAQSLRDSEQLFRLLAENSTDAISRLSPSFETLYVSPAIQQIIGYTPQELIGRHPLETVHPDDVDLLRAAYNESVSNPGKVATVAYRRRHRKGHYIWCETTGRAILGKDGTVEEIHVITRDISARRRAEEQLRAAEARYRSIFENAVEGIFQTSPDGHYLAANPSLARIYGFESPSELLGSYSDISRQLYIDARVRAEFIEEMKKEGKVSNFEAQIRRKNGQIIWISENAREVRGDDGELLYYEGTVEDITARKVAQDQLLHDALHDKLTGLANRALFSDRMAQAFARLKRHPDAVFAVLFLDFDRFKNINDSLGHMAGDELLVAMARRLEGCLRPGDTVSRLGGDEFAILLEDVRDQSDATVVAERVQTAMSSPFTLLGQEIFSSASIGIAVAHADYENPDDLLRDADMAMYRAKSLGKARHEVFDTGMHTRAVALLQLETDLRWAIERQEFELHYQPIVSLQTGKIIGFEALVRWRHPERGVVAPAEFIPVAEETGWIVPIGTWVLETACEQLARWQKKLKYHPPLTMSVNLSGKQFSQPNLIPHIREQLQKWNIAPENLKLEITESAIMENAQAVTERLHILRSLGVKLALDDFGTGYSSLSYLHRFPLDTLKIDRSFVMRMQDGGENREIVRTIVALGLNLGMDVIAEGIEDIAQLKDLRDLNCNCGQGFFFARPLTAEEAFELLKNSPIW
ncbi:putative signaling protein [Abditibacteriota bacterium]|nr:putative signaling protein [Abditibacteriota bacterium]